MLLVCKTSSEKLNKYSKRFQQVIDVYLSVRKFLTLSYKDAISPVWEKKY